MSHSPTTLDSNEQGDKYHQGWVALDNLIRSGRSLSGRERNCAFLNTGQTGSTGPRFANVSGGSGFDFPDDSRGLALVDWDHDGDVDVWVSNRTAPSVRMLRNNTPQENHWLAVRLEGNGTTTNRDAIGARVEVRVRSKENSALRTPHSAPVKTLRAGEGFQSQSSKWLHFGLGSATHVARVIVHWPGGELEEFTGAQPDRRYRIVQGSGRLQSWAAPRQTVELLAAELESPTRSHVARTFLAEPMPLPTLRYTTFDGHESSLGDPPTRPVLLNMWATWCSPCVKELHQMAEKKEQIESAGVDIVALSVDALDEDKGSSSDASQLLARLKFPFAAGDAPAALVDRLQIVHDQVYGLNRPLPIPCSFLIDRQGSLAAVYKGLVEVEQLLADVAVITTEGQERWDKAIPFPGRWISPPNLYRPVVLASELFDEGYVDDVLELIEENESRFPPRSEFANLLISLARSLRDSDRLEDALQQCRRALSFKSKMPSLHHLTGSILERMGQLDEARKHYRQEIEVDSSHAESHNRLAVLSIREQRFDEALPHLRVLATLRPDEATTHYNLALILKQIGQQEEALEHFRATLNIDRDFADAHYHLGTALYNQQDTAAAIRHLREVIRLRPNAAQAYSDLGMALMDADNVAEAVELYRRALELQPDSATAQNNLAWVLATHPDDELRNGEEAVQWAEKVCQQSGYTSFAALDTLAAALAEAGRFEEAAKTAKQAVSLARGANQDETVRQIEQRLQLYKTNEPYRSDR